MIDGHAQRKALTAAERAIDRLADGDADGARRAAVLATELDQIGLYAGFPAVLERAAADLEQSGAITGASRAALVDALGPGPLAIAVETRLG